MKKLNELISQKLSALKEKKRLQKLAGVQESPQPQRSPDPNPGPDPITIPRPYVDPNTKPKRKHVIGPRPGAKPAPKSESVDDYTPGKEKEMLSKIIKRYNDETQQ